MGASSCLEGVGDDSSRKSALGLGTAGEGSAGPLGGAVGGARIVSPRLFRPHVLRCNDPTPANMCRGRSFSRADLWVAHPRALTSVSHAGRVCRVRQLREAMEWWLFELKRKRILPDLD